VRLIKLPAIPLLGSKAATLAIAAAPARAGRPADRAERVRKLLLTVAFATLGLLLTLVVLSDPAALPRLAQSLPLAALAEVELMPGLSGLKALAASVTLAAAWQLTRRLRRSFAAHRAALPVGNSGAQAALVAAWTSKASRPPARPEPAPEPLLFQPPPPPPLAPIPMQELADPAAAGDFLNWGRQAARSGDQLVAYRLLMQAVRLEPRSQDAWLWLAGTCDDRDEAIHCLEQVLKLNPANAFAQRGLAELLAADRP
jgi:tetratricopeptide (TPR) repeat protein